MKGGYNRQMQLYSNHPFLAGDIRIKVKEDHLIFSKPAIDYNGKTFKFCKNRKESERDRRNLLEAG